MCGNRQYESRDDKVYTFELLMEMLYKFCIGPCHDLGAFLELLSLASL